MIKKTTAISSLPERDYKILSDLSVQVRIDSNPYHLALDNVFALAARNNPKRAYLFVSKLIGKHIPVNPSTPLVTSALLASSLATYLQLKVNPETVNTLNLPSYQFPGNGVFIGFAETATALGHGVFACFNGAVNYLHTTREPLRGGWDTIFFTEDHCHAPDQRLLINHPHFLQNKDYVILIDDEITTGNLGLNIIKSIQQKYPQKQYLILTILDWRSAEAKEKYRRWAEELGVKITVLSLLSGQFTFQGATPVISELPIPVVESLPQVECLTVSLGETIVLGGQDGGRYLRWTGRFGMDTQDQQNLRQKAGELGARLSATRQGKRTLCLGTGEFMYLPFLVASAMGSGVSVQSTTRSPVHPRPYPDYAVKQAIWFNDPFNPTVKNFVYNIPPDTYDEVFIFWERPVQPQAVAPLLVALDKLGIKKIIMVECQGAEADNLGWPTIPDPEKLGSYAPRDAVFLLKDIGAFVQEQGNAEREKAIQEEGHHYSEMLPIEYQPGKEYMELFYQSLKKSARRMALATGLVAATILQRQGPNTVLVSLARAGTPVGVLIKRYLLDVYGLNLPHYSISIIRDKGIDENALRYILQHHSGSVLQFVDGWTGKGTITGELNKTLDDFAQKYPTIKINRELAVLADPGYCANIFGTRDDFLIPSACLNATVSGLMSRTVYRKDLIGPLDFHGAKYYREMAGEDQSCFLVDEIVKHFPAIKGEVAEELRTCPQKYIDEAPSWLGKKEMLRIKDQFGIPSLNLIKPGVGETTRVLLRRVPWKILVKDIGNRDLEHILVLAEERGVSVEVYKQMTYSCCGLIQPLEKK